MRLVPLAACLPALLTAAAEFQTGQAARAVIGQPSFSAQEQAIGAAALQISNGKLFAADPVRHAVFTFDLTKIPGAKDDASGRSGACPLCGFQPIAQSSMAVLPGIAAFSVSGHMIAVADEPNHRVLLWSNAAAPRPAAPITLADLVDPVSVAVDGKRLFVGDAALHRVLVWNSLPTADNQPFDAVLGQPDASSTADAETLGADTISRPAALASDGTNLYVSDPIRHRILVFSPGDTPLPQDAVVNGATLAPGPLALGTLIDINGAGFADEPASARDDAGRLPTTLAGVQVLLNGLALPLMQVSPTQVRAQLPYDLGHTSAASLFIRTLHDDGTVSITTATGIRIAPASPGLFAFAGTEPRTGLALHSTPAAQPSDTPVTQEEPAHPGETLTLWATGLGAVSSGTEAAPIAGVPYDGPDSPATTPVAAIIDGRPAQVLSAALPHGAVGVYEIRVVLPEDSGAGTRAQLTIVQNGVPSNTVVVPVRPHQPGS